MNFELEQPTTDELRMLIWEEVLRYHPTGSPRGGPAAGGTQAAALEDKAKKRLLLLVGR